MDQAAALQWLRRNIAAFGGDPQNVTTFGESSGSFSVAAQMASPMAKTLVAKAIGESGGFADLMDDVPPLAVTEQDGAKFANELGAGSLEQLRALPAPQLLDAVMKSDPFRFGPNVDGSFFPLDPREIYEKGEQAQVPLLAGWNRDEFPYETFFGKEAPTRENYEARVRRQFGAQAQVILNLLPGMTDGQVKQSASTWVWLELHTRSRAATAYRYQFDQPIPLMAGSPQTANGREALVEHTYEIPYVFGTFGACNPRPWTTEDHQLSGLMATYWTNFAKTGNPNGKGLARWPEYSPKDGFQVMHLDATSQPKADDQRAQCLELDKVAQALRKKAQPSAAPPVETSPSPGIAAQPGVTATTPPAGSEGLVGTWRLVSCADWDEKGKLILLYGEHPTGYIVYDSTGHVFVQFMRTPAVPPWASKNEDTATTAEKLAAFNAYAAYFGTYTIDWEHGTVVHHVEGSLDPMYTHTDQPRPFVLDGDTLTIGDQKTWKRVLQRVR